MNAAATVLQNCIRRIGSRFLQALCCVIGIASAGLPQIGNAAEIGLAFSVRGEARDQPTGIKISGIIEPGDAEKFTDALRVLSGFQPIDWLTVELDSPGGDLLEAMQIASEVNRYRLLTRLLSAPQTRPLPECLSACFFIYVAGAERHEHFGFSREDNIGLGVHRPYFERDYFSGLSSSEAEARYLEISSEARAFLYANEVSDELVELLFRTPSSGMHMISREEFDAWIGFSKAFFEEWIHSQCTEYWLSPEEEEDFLRGGMSNQDFSEGYKQYLWNKVTGRLQCRRQAIISEQYELLGADFPMT